MRDLTVFQKSTVLISILKAAALTAFLAALPASAQEDFTPLSIPPATPEPMTAPPATPETVTPKPTTSLPGKLPAKDWQSFNASASFLGAFGTHSFLGLEVFAGSGFGSVPAFLNGTDGLRQGTLWGAGLVFDVGAGTATDCARATYCMTRFGGGGALRYGLANGTTNTKGETSVDHWYYAEVDVLGAYSKVPSAPLVGASEWGDLILRLRAGLFIDTSDGPISSHSLSGIFNLTASVFFEAMPLPNRAQGVSGGFSLGLAI